MPGFDGTGPRGQGPRTGGGWGRCAPLPNETWAPRGVGRGGLPWGGGRGRCWGGGARGGWGRGQGFARGAGRGPSGWWGSPSASPTEAPAPESKE
jgi:hypothetical protein